MTRTTPALLAVLLAAGCGGGDAGRGATDGGPTEPADAGVGADGGGAPSPDASVRDGGPDLDTTFPGLPVDPDGLAGTDRGYEDADDTSGASCVDGEDDDGNDVLDCEDAKCTFYGTCCVGNGDCCSTAGTQSWDPSTCADLASCGMTPFGEPSSTLVGGTLVPGGDDMFDSGVVLDGASYDARIHRLAIDVTLHGPTGCGTSCLESAGVALTAQESLGDATHVQSAAGLLLGGSSGLVALVVSGEVVARFEMTADPQAWRLVLRPTGELSVERAGEELTDPRARPRWRPTDGLRLVAYGRSRDPSSGTGARIGSIAAERSLCDIPSAWDERATLTLLEGGTEVTPAAPAGPSVATDGAARWLVYEDRGVIRLASQEGGDPTRFTVAGQPLGMGRDPDLFWDATAARWLLFYGDGDGTILRRETTTADPVALADATPVEVLGPGRFEALQAPSVATHVGSTGRLWVMAVRAVSSDGSHRLAIYWSRDGASWELVERGDVAGMRLEVLSGSDSNTGIADGWDAIGSPSLVIFDRAWHMYYDRRRGTRAATGLLASTELLRWRDAGEALAPSDGIDRIAVRDPAAVAGTGEVELYYVADDGVQPRLARAVRTANEAGP